MTEADLRKLQRNKKLIDFISRSAWRYFHNEEQVKDAVAEAWERIYHKAADLSLEECQRHGYNAIHAMYRRVRRRKKNLKEISVDAGKEKEPSSALRALAQKAIDGDW